MPRSYGFANVRFRDEKLCAEIIVCDRLIVDQGDGAYAGQDKVLCNLISETFHSDKQYAGVPNLFLALDTPKSDLSVI